LIYGATSAFSRIATLLLLPLLTAYLTPAEHGVLSLLTVLTAILVPLLSLGLGAAAGAAYFEANNAGRKASTIWTSLLLMAPGVILLVSIASGYPTALSMVMFDSASYARPVAITLLSTACSIAALPFTMYLQFEERAGVYACVMLTSSAISMVVTVAGVVWLRLGIDAVVFGTLVGQAAIVMLLSVIVGTKLPVRFSRVVLDELIRLGLPLVPAFAFLLVVQHGNRFLLERLNGLDALGIYTVGFNLGLALSLLVGAFQSAWLPFAMSFAERQDEARSVFGRVLTYYAIAGGALTVLFFVGARPAVLLLTQPNFHDAYQVVGFSAATQFFIGAFSIFLPGVYFARKVQYVTFVQAVTAIAAILLNLLLIPQMGVPGAGLALALGAFMLPMLQHGWNMHHRSIRLRVHYEWRRVGTVLAVYSSIGALTLWPRSISSGTEMVFAGLAGSSAIAAAYCSLSISERAALWRMARGLRSSLLGTEE
jgi:O-antigen/teichoic acid export membrane protein